MIASALLLAAQSFAAEPVVRQPQAIDWKVSGTLPQGLATHEYHLVYEDAATRGIVTLVRFSKGYNLPLHSHSHDETIIVLKGSLEITLAARTEVLEPGGYAVVPAGTPHALKARGWSGCQLVVNFSGPMDYKPASKP